MCAADDGLDRGLLANGSAAPTSPLHAAIPSAGAQNGISSPPTLNSVISPRALAGVIKLKVVMLGDSLVGKTSMLERFQNNNFRHQEPTSGHEWRGMTVRTSRHTVRLQIYDIACWHQNRTTEVAKLVQDAGAGIVVYSVASRTSYKQAGTFLKFLRKEAARKCVFLVGNKCDLEQGREVMHEEGNRLAAEYNAEFFEASALDGSNVTSIFQTLAQQATAEGQPGYGANTTPGQTPRDAGSQSATAGAHSQLGAAGVRSTVPFVNEETRSRRCCCFFSGRPRA